MEEQKKSTLEYILHYGALLGLFWMFKYLFKIGESYWVHFIYFYHLLNVVSPLLMYIFYLQYKNKTPELKHGVWRCVLFVVGICFFGSIFEGVIQYAHYAFINPDVFANVSAVGIGIAESTLKVLDENGMFKNMSAEQIVAVKNQYMDIVSSKMLYIVNNMVSQVFLGFIFSLLIGFLTRMNNSTQQ